MFNLLIRYKEIRMSNSDIQKINT
ncbi:RidA family protein, partial [Acinetobacter baumannii]|nr:RidA family protein [Acinetobacter baumannii]